ncbi:MAG: hypothetical protein COA45_12420 [Zetaproteobacteria bacterium]|nr:MAG: hypothetical protein COA45_12420 [Zetaproteobacteria bacterium]
MQVEVNIKATDIIKSCLYLVPQSKLSWGISFLFVSVMAYKADLVSKAEHSVGISFVSTIIACFIFILGFMTLFVFASILQTLIISRTKNGFLCRHNFEIANEGLIETTEVNKTLVKWEGITKLLKTKRYIYVYAGVGYHILPKRDFETDEQFNAFYDALNEGYRNRVI